ncbi:GAF domain-containing sensor histidine kinase [Amycolatopsis alkalitolerans]|uniref:GAF domain-containing sensor histidine kinase n=1 Tax=Amycolatopsis alkalitolerans TaxID=2547244 RepID=A0A5C4M5N5_9PSEU|nr:GAF domain-containing sensor histidine kinase [Amycolatopsis alkalitolerans]
MCPACGRPPGEDERRGQLRLAAIARAASSVADAASLSVTLDVVAREVVQATHIAAVQILKVEQGKMRVVGKAGFTDADDFAERLEECRQLGARMMFVEAFEAEKRIVVPHRKAAVLADPKWGPLHRIMGAPDWDTFVAVPLVVRGRAVGVLNAFYSPGEDPVDETLEFLEAMADQAAMAVDSAELLGRSRREAQLHERARLARELHDSVVQQVFSMRMQAKALRAQVGTSEHVQDVADELLELAQNALADLRGLVLQLHPLDLAGRDLAGAIRTLAESVQAASGVRIQISATDLPPLPTDLADDVYRIVQEALNNVVKHAQATSAEVSVAAAGGKLTVEVTDDGVGLAGEPRPQALGLVSMRERAQRWSGTTEIGNSTGGCHVRVRMTLPADGRP